MDKKLLDYIRVLSDQDTKSLSQKALKTAEEVGELAKKILPYEGAFATNHRIVAKDEILEEVADVILCALSIAYNLNATDEEVEAKLTEKSMRWSDLQSRENGGKFPLPFEIHITVNLAESKDIYQPQAIEYFREVCKDIGVKPIILDLQDKQGVSVMTDVMTSSKHFGSNTSALEYANTIAHALSEKGFRVVRTKLETVPWHPAAPQKDGDKMPKDCYFEAHIPVSLHEYEINQLSDLMRTTDSGVHLSRNTFKTLEDGRVVLMLTHRWYARYASAFTESVDSIVACLKANKFDVGKVHTEFAVYDTKVAHDASWLK